MSDFYELVTAPIEQPLTFNTASKWCRDIHSEDADLVTALIKSATNLFESMSNRVFVTRSLTGKFPGVCSSNQESHPFVAIKRSPLIAISEIRTDGDVLDPTAYAIKESSSFARVWFLENLDLDVDTPYPIEIDFTAGYGLAASLPSEIITMLEQTILFWYENRGDVSTDEKQQIPFVAKQILKSIRIVNTF